MINAVTFDVWETMIHDNAALGERRGELRIVEMIRALGQAGFAVDERLVRAAYHASWVKSEQIWETGREVDHHEQLLMLLADVDSDLPAKLGPMALSTVEAAYVDPIYATPPALSAHLVPALKALQSEGKRIGLVCNTGRTPGYAMRRLLTTYDVLHYFDAVAFSDEEGVRKPDPEIFRRVLRGLGTPPSEAVHVGDNLVADIAGAKSAGMHAVLIGPACPSNPPVPPDAYIRDLDELLKVLNELDASFRRAE